MDYRIFNVRTDINARDRTQGFTDTVRESTLKVDSKKKNPLLHQGIEPVLATCQSNARPTELHPHYDSSCNSTTATVPRACPQS